MSAEIFPPRIGNRVKLLGPKCAKCGDTNVRHFYPSIQYRCKVCHSAGQRRYEATPEGQATRNAAQRKRYANNIEEMRDAAYDRKQDYNARRVAVGLPRV